MLCIAVFLFSYINSNFFWHGHKISGSWIFHSHIASASHRSSPEENTHTSTELLLIQAFNQASFTDEVMPYFSLEPISILLVTVQAEPVSWQCDLAYDHSFLRGPPAFV